MIGIVSGLKFLPERISNVFVPLGLFANMLKQVAMSDNTNIRQNGTASGSLKKFIIDNKSGIIIVIFSSALSLAGNSSAALLKCFLKLIPRNTFSLRL